MKIILAWLLIFLLQGCSDDETNGGVSTSGIEVSIPAITTKKFASGFNSPVQITHAGDGSKRLFVLEKQGAIKVIMNGVVLETPFVDISNKVNANGGEQGLLGIAFPPQFVSKRHFYLHYTSRRNIGDSVIERMSLTENGETADPSSAQNLLTVVQPFPNHNGGQLAFGPDGYLYIGLGDGGGNGDPFNNAQNLSSLLGKILRIDVESGGNGYRIPSGNTLGNEIWAYGLRNPWRFSFDKETGDLYIADVGQNQFEELNVQDKNASSGANYGWKLMEGSHCFNSETCSQTGLTMPVHEYAHSDQNCSIIGGHVYRGNQYPLLRGVYIYGDLCSGRIWGIRQTLQGTWENKLILDTDFFISSFGEDEEGNIYLADFRSGDIHQIVLP